MHARFTPTSYTPPQDRPQEDNTINLVFVTPSKDCDTMDAPPPVGSAANGVDGIAR
jgi:hypothetical protein